jgi:hypothetical protein
LEFPAEPPTHEEILETDRGQRLLAGFLIRRYADRTLLTGRDDQTVVRLDFDH